MVPPKTTRLLISFSLSVLVAGGTTAGCAATGGGLASASGRAVEGRDAALAGKALAKGDAVGAVAFAEAAVAGSPRRADYRVLLGKSYLRAGRFRSARAAFADALTLNPGNGPAALDLALAEIATGDWSAARATLAANAAIIAPSDHGLALALAGDPAGAVKLLIDAARTPGANARTRQNLGLALALAGQWSWARTIVAADVSPAEVDRRMLEWAAFAQPTHASDQVAALLGVRAQDDAGQPTALALVAPAPAVVAADAVAAPVLPVARIVFGPRREVVQPLPPRLAAAPMPGKATSFATGEWFVQLGAFHNAKEAHAAWGRITQRDASLAVRMPQGLSVRAKSGPLYQLSIGRFDRAGADALCRRHRATGGDCFVRRSAGETLAQWIRRPAQRAG